MQKADALVVDASGAAKWHLVDEDGATEALLLLRRYLASELDLVAPEHIRYEVPNAIAVASQRRPEFGGCTT